MGNIEKIGPLRENLGNIGPLKGNLVPLKGHLGPLIGNIGLYSLQRECRASILPMNPIATTSLSMPFQ